MTATSSQIADILYSNFGKDVGAHYQEFHANLPTSSLLGVPLAPLRPMMLELKAAGTKVAVLTSDDRRFTEAFLDHHGVLDLVSTMVCGDDGLAPKPSAEPLMAICDEVGVLPEEAAMVGDSGERDVGSGLAAGFGSVIGVSSGISSEEELRASGAHAVLPTVAHVPSALRQRHTHMSAAPN